MFFIFLHSIKEVNVLWNTWLPVQRLSAILFNFMFKEACVTLCSDSEIATEVKEVTQ